jgi:predicted lipoprotein with Yx(FWY)xxD motif
MSTPATGPRPAPSSAPAAAGIVITTAGSDFGTMLFDVPGQAIYLFDKETAGRPDCYGDCAVAWPPVLTTGNPQAAGQARPDLLGTVARDDGSTQVTYAGHPLYYYAHEGPGQVLCHNVVEFGGRWLVVTPGGAPAA